MKTKLIIGLLCVAAILAWTGIAYAQTATPAPKVKLSSGEEVWNLQGLWEVAVENYGPWAAFGTYPQVWSIKQNGSAFSAIRMKDNPVPSPGKAGNPSLFAELDATGFTYIFLVDGTGVPWRITGQISEDGKTIKTDEGTRARSTLTRPSDCRPVVAGRVQRDPAAGGLRVAIRSVAAASSRPVLTHALAESSAGGDRETPGRPVGRESAAVRIGSAAPDRHLDREVRTSQQVSPLSSPAGAKSTRCRPALVVWPSHCPKCRCS